MPNFNVTIFSDANIINPQNPGNLPAEDSTFRSDLTIGQQITWLGGAESALISITDNANTAANSRFDEAQSNQTLTSGVTFDGSTYLAGQVVTPSYTIVFTGTDSNTYIMTSFNFSPNSNNQIPDAIFWEGTIPPPGMVLTVTNEINPTGSTARNYANMAVCFAAGTHLATPTGPQPVESLRIGDLVLSLDHGAGHIEWIGMRHFGPDALALNPKLRPIRIAAGALGAGLPQRNLLVSPHHRLMISSKIAGRMFGVPEILVAAHVLTDFPGIDVATGVQSVSYFHVLLATHSILLAEGAPAESLYLGEETFRALGQRSIDTLVRLKPEINDPTFQPTSARLIPDTRRQRHLIRRHVKNNMPLIGNDQRFDHRIPRVDLAAVSRKIRAA